MAVFKIGDAVRIKHDDTIFEHGRPGLVIDVVHKYTVGIPLYLVQAPVSWPPRVLIISSLLPGYTMEKFS